VRDDAAELPAAQKHVDETTGALVRPALAKRNVPGPAPRGLVSLVAVRPPVVGGDVQAVLGPRRGEADLALIALGDAVRVRGQKPESQADPLAHLELKPVVLGPARVLDRREVAVLRVGAALLDISWGGC